MDRRLEQRGVEVEGVDDSEVLVVSGHGLVEAGGGGAHRAFGCLEIVALHDEEALGASGVVEDQRGG